MSHAEYAIHIVKRARNGYADGKFTFRRGNGFIAEILYRLVKRQENGLFIPVRVHRNFPPVGGLYESTSDVEKQ